MSSTKNDLSKDDLDFLMDLNKFTYRKPLDTSLINTRQLRRYNFSSAGTYNTVGTSQAEIVLNSGSDYIYGPNSFIEMKIAAVKADGTPASAATKFSTATSVGSSAMNLFKSCEIVHRSGDQLDYTQDLNSLVQTLVAYDSESYTKLLPLMGDDVDFAVPTTVILPLWLFSGIFAQEALMPGNLTGGMRVTLQFEDFARATGTNADGVSYNITNMALVLDSYIPFDAVASELKEAQANEQSQGLQFPYYSYHSISKSQPTTNIGMDLNFSAGKIMSVILKSRSQANDDGADNIGSEAYPFTKIQAQLGSLRFPQQPIDSSQLAYYLTIQSFDGTTVNDLVNQRKSNIGVSYDQYATANTGTNVIAWDLEKSQVLKLSGELTNNSRLLSITGETDAAVATRNLSVWIKHMKIVNIQLDNVTIDR